MEVGDSFCRLVWKSGQLVATESFAGSDSGAARNKGVFATATSVNPPANCRYDHGQPPPTSAQGFSHGLSWTLPVCHLQQARPVSVLVGPTCRSRRNAPDQPNLPLMMELSSLEMPEGHVVEPDPPPLVNQRFF